MNEQEPRFRAFRGLMYGLYLVVVVSFSLAVTFSVAKSVNAMSPKRPKDVEVILSSAECVAQVETLWAELDSKRRELSQLGSSTRRADKQWALFRVQWLQRHRHAEASCAVDSQERVALREFFKKIDRAMDLYTTHAVQFAGEMGPTIDSVNGLLAKLKETNGR